MTILVQLLLWLVFLFGAGTPAAVTPAPVVPAIPAPVAAVASVSRALPQTTVTYRGVNHLWIPALGISQRVYIWGCSPAALPPRVEDWTCSGHDDLYLVGHAGSVFRPIYLYYERHGRLPAGLDLYEASSTGHVTHYRLTWTKRVAWNSATEYAIAYQNLSAPSVTLQTCLNASGTVDLLARFVAVR